MDEQLLCDHASANAHLFYLLKFSLSTSKLLEKCYARHTYAGNRFKAFNGPYTLYTLRVSQSIDWNDW